MDSMKFGLLVLCVVLIAWVASRSAKSYFVASQPTTIYFIYADWCGACKKLKPDWEKIKADYTGKSAIIDVNEKDKAAIKDLETKYGLKVAAYPTITAVRGGKLIPYPGFKDGKHSVDYLRDFVNKL